MTREVDAERRKKFLRIKIITMIICVIAAVLVFILVNLYRVSDEMSVGVEFNGNTLYFGETASRVKSDLDTPNSAEEKPDGVVYCYTGTAYGSLCDTYLTFRGNRLVEATFTISKTDDFGKFEKVIESVSEVYKSREGYFITDKATYDSSGYCRISGRSDGAELVCDIYNKENVVYIETRAGN